MTAARNKKPRGYSALLKFKNSYQVLSKETDSELSQKKKRPC